MNDRVKFIGPPNSAKRAPVRGRAATPMSFGASSMAYISTTTSTLRLSVISGQVGISGLLSLK